ncbi:MAG: energy-coupling factor transport system permease protein [Methanohalophilus sp.]|nr:energy-coupling factor transport system permease protein [Methanohalophilus sp.]
MRKYDFFGFVISNSFVHKLDPRAKLFALIGLSILIFRISAFQNLLFPLTIFIMAAYFSGTSIKRHVLSVRPLIPFLIAIFLFHFLLTPGQESIGF